MPKNTINVIFIRKSSIIRYSRHWQGSGKYSKFFGIPFPVIIRITTSGEDYKVIAHNSAISIKRKKKLTIIVYVFSLLECESLRYIMTDWKKKKSNLGLANIPIILVGSETDIRDDPVQPRQLISPEIGKQIARRINAIKYIEIHGPYYAEASLDKIFQEIIDTSLLYEERKIRKPTLFTYRPFRFAVVELGSSKISNMLVKYFVFCKRLNVCDECINEQTFFYPKNSKTFETLIEIDGEVHDLVIDSLCMHEPKFLECEYDAIILTFSVADPYSYNNITNHLIQDLQSSRGIAKAFNPLPVILAAGNHTECRNTLADVESLSDLSDLGVQTLTFEIGEELAHRVGAVKYVEYSCCDGVGIQNVFVEAMWAVLRKVEMSRKQLKLKSFFKRFL